MQIARSSNLPKFLVCTVFQPTQKTASLLLLLLSVSLSLLKIVRWKELYTVVGEGARANCWGWEMVRNNLLFCSQPSPTEKQQVTQHYTHLFP